jgi:hypothetical protein
MSASAFASIQAALVAALQAALPAGVPVHANRVRPVARETGRSVLVRRLDSREVDTGTLGCTDWLTTFSVRSMAAPVATGADPDALADELLQTVWQALTGLVLPDAIDTRTEPGIDWDFDATEVQAASAQLRFSVLHRTQANTLTPWSA